MSPRTRSWPLIAERAEPRALVLDIGATADLDVATTDMLAALHGELARTWDRLPPRPGAWVGPRPDAPDRPDDDHRRGPLLPVGRGRRRRAAPGAPVPGAGGVLIPIRAAPQTEWQMWTVSRPGVLEPRARTAIIGQSRRHPSAGTPPRPSGRRRRRRRCPRPRTRPARPIDRDIRRAEDAPLLARIVDHDEAAVEALYARYSGPLYSLAYRVTGAERFAQDVVQEVFIALWKDAARFDPSRGSVGPWLFSLARHKAIDLVRREANVRKRTAEVDMELEVASRRCRSRRVAEPAARSRARGRRTLSEAQRTALELAFFGGLTHVEVAERLGIPLGTAKTRIRTALLNLRTRSARSSPRMKTSPMDRDRWTTNPSAD